MKTYFGLEALDPPLARSVLTVGNFDGVHRGHLRLIARAVELGRLAGAPAVVLTFEPHPLTVVAPARAPLRLCTLEDKLRLVGEAGADIVVVAKSEPALMSLEAEVFVNSVLRDRFHPVHMVEGPSFGFGRGRRGTSDLLKRTAKDFGCEVHIIEPLMLRLDGGEPTMISSSLIRSLLTQCQVEAAATALGRPYELIGTVVVGDGRGRQLGFPTANLEIIDQLVPGDGVYAGEAVVSDENDGSLRRPCAISIGRTPTFGTSDRRVEAHILDFDADIYGRTLRITFDRFLREQRKFPSPEALAQQLSQDVAMVRAGRQSAGGKTVVVHSPLA